MFDESRLFCNFKEITLIETITRQKWVWDDFLKDNKGISFLRNTVGRPKIITFLKNDNKKKLTGGKKKSKHESMR